MGFRFRRGISLARGVRINLGKNGASLSFGTRGLSVNVGRKGIRTTGGIPGTGVSYSDYNSYQDLAGYRNVSSAQPLGWAKALTIGAIAIAIIWLIIG